jgi:hypothetical protein
MSARAAVTARALATGYCERVKVLGAAAVASARVAAAQYPEDARLRAIAATRAAAFAQIENDSPARMLARPLLTFDNAKTVKGEAQGYRTAILYLAAADYAGVRDMCAHKSAACYVGCLLNAGRAALFITVNAARVRKTWEYDADRVLFGERLKLEVAAAQRFCARHAVTLCVRLNGTSDMDWRAVIGAFPETQFYDYTKNPYRRALTPNYHLTFSRSESAANAIACAETPLNVAVVFGVKRGAPLPSHYMGRPVVDGDLSDLRFLDPDGVVVGLRAKGPAKRDTLGFVVRITD